MDCRVAFDRPIFKLVAAQWFARSREEIATAVGEGDSRQCAVASKSTRRRSTHLLIAFCRRPVTTAGEGEVAAERRYLVRRRASGRGESGAEGRWVAVKPAGVIGKAGSADVGRLRRVEGGQEFQDGENSNEWRGSPPSRVDWHRRRRFRQAYRARRRQSRRRYKWRSVVGSSSSVKSRPPQTSRVRQLRLIGSIDVGQCPLRS